MSEGISPLGSFDILAPLNADAVAKGKALYTLLLKDYPCPSNTLQRIYLHWTVGHYNQNFNDYNISVSFDGTHFGLNVVGNPQDNAIGVNSNPVHSHTYMRNTGAVGIATDDMIGATATNFGPEPLTMATLEYLCAGTAAAALAYGVDISGLSEGAPFSGEPTVLTHAEAANRVGNPWQYYAYGPLPVGDVERWDLASFVAGANVNDQGATICGNALRARSHIYKLELTK
jgi:hypothetical protein